MPQRRVAASLASGVHVAVVKTVLGYHVGW